jgi:hypothetical protein
MIAAIRANPITGILNTLFVFFIKNLLTFDIIKKAGILADAKTRPKKNSFQQYTLRL